MNGSLDAYSIIAGVIANGLFSILLKLGQKFKEEINVGIIQSDRDISIILHKAIEEFAFSISYDGTDRSNKLFEFITSAELETIIREIFSTKIENIYEISDLSKIREEFSYYLSIYLEIPFETSVSISSELFDAIIRSCEKSIEISINYGILSAHEAKSSFRYRMILDELKSLEKKFDEKSTRSKFSLQKILDFQKKYHKQMANRHRHITPPNFDNAKKMAINDLYVSPNFLTVPNKKDEQSQEVTASDFLKKSYRSVIVGNPGSGKSTYVSKLCYDLSLRYDDKLFGGRKITPILVILRDYGVAKREHNYSILQFIEVTSNSKYMVPPDPNTFEYLLINGQALVIFDGLDELLDTSYRIEISSDIESFCSRYPSVPVIVTSRRVGYEQAPLDDSIFETFILAPFTESQISEYVSKWFTIEEDQVDQKKKKSESFLRESKIVPDLRSNPLMLALMCNIYKGENYIPKNRPDVYEKCATMLFERSDKSKGIQFPLPFEAHIKPTMMYLAYWIYSDPKLQGGVKEAELIAKTSEYLLNKRFEDPDEAQHASKQFIDFCTGRAWIFSDIGTTPTGEKIFHFTHRTFLEYFTAAYLVRIYETTDALGLFLLEHIKKREWDVVAQLAFQSKNKSTENSGDKLLDLLISHICEFEEKRILLSFAARCLEFMVPSREVVRSITKNSIENVITYSTQGKTLNPIDVIGPLFFAASENQSTIADCTEKLLIERINQENIPNAITAAQIAVFLEPNIYRISGQESMPSKDLVEFWNSISKRIIDKCYDKIEDLSKKDRFLGQMLFWDNRIKINDFIEFYGVESFFTGTECTIYSINLIELAYNILHACVNFESINDEKAKQNLLENTKLCGEILKRTPRPWVKFDYPRFWIESVIRDCKKSEKAPDLSIIDKDALFGFLLILMPYFENLKRNAREINKLKDILNECDSIFMRNIRSIIFAFLDNDLNDVVKEDIKNLRFERDQDEFIQSWIGNKFITAL